jgi:hypothetical protein
MFFNVKIFISPYRIDTFLGPCTYNNWKAVRGGNKMDRPVLLFLAAILAGFALVKVPLSGTVFAAFTPFTNFIGILAILVFSLVLIYKASLALLRK